MTSLLLKDVSKTFGRGTAKVNALTDVNFEATQGQLVLILGPSGSGKSTFLTIAGSLQTPTSGTVMINDQNVQELSAKAREKLRLNHIGFVLQSYNLVPYLTVKEQFKLVDKVKKSGNLSNQKLDELLTLLGIKELENKYPDQLSGGQSQRVAIARALYPDPAIILADEPTAALDSKHVEEVGQLLAQLAHEHHKAVVVVTHDLRLKHFADQIYDITDGRMTREK
ncbi:MAG: ABC transporter ATP-binding protein [Candidatus Paralactobacillus gallistercoris]|uniref:Putative hemin import ATP-binding protein HrtA n=1 Tax=Candidatus Paralactobacillus gallistercoris TaxID=2838724 RepID=A0A948WZI1_9LACO|nr:ABC transporter ATP-binding protein [Candidatus Paralactobacillus gallistercoris]